jgi:transcription-repair coupling factor (superfamily II helicase)
MPFLEPLYGAIDLHRLAGDLKAGRRLTVGNAWGASPALLAASLVPYLQRPLVLIAPTLSEAEDAVQDLETFGVKRATLYPEIENLSSPSPLILSERARAVLDPGDVLVASIRAALEPGHADKERMKFRVGDSIRLPELSERLVAAGYTRAPVVEEPGEFAIRGSVVDVFPMTSDHPVRLELDADELVSVRLFRVDDQTSMQTTPALDLAMGKIQSPGYHDDWPTLLELMPEALPLLIDIAQIDDKVRKFYDEPRYWKRRFELFQQQFASRAGLTFQPLPAAREQNLKAAPPPRFQKSSRPVAVELEEASREFDAVVVFCATQAEAERLQGMIRDAGVSIRGLQIHVGRLSRGFALVRTAYLPHHELLQRQQLRRSLRKAPGRAAEIELELDPGDYVVHTHYGIGRFMGFEKHTKDGREVESVVLQYHGGTKLYVPVQDMGLLQKYMGAGEKPQELSKLGGTGWANTKAEAAKAIEELAKDLLAVQAKRELVGGFAYPPDDDMQRLFEASFPYEETEDQLRITAEIKKDMLSGRAMDRLLCGDVGFGKTELSMRAAFKAVTAGKQVAILCPTTILAQQHFQSFQARMADYPVRLDVLSRFRTKGEQSKIIKRVKEGEIDIIIGTHRLVQPDVGFKDLGLLIIDEEQRFGVEQKEALKRFRATVDVLTLSATPIPRTLHMALLSIRDISVLSTPPFDRLAVLTQVATTDDMRIREAIILELERNGQVFFIHNRVHSIQRVLDRLQAIVPEARFGLGHGQMDPDELEETMLKFINGEIDVLVATSIIENGIDIPNANTLIVDNADQFGLSDMHQLRGRVGRYNRQAYAYFLIPRDRPLSPESARRLRAIEELSELGSGFKIALRDMEIRGVGNILGREQHGHIRAVGYEMYLQLLEREVKKIRKEPIEEVPEATVSVKVDALVPESTIPDLPTRVQIYQTIGRARSIKELNDVRRQFIDRFGPTPEPMENLFKIQTIKILLSKRRLLSLTDAKEGFMVKFVDRRDADLLRRSRPDRVRIVDDETLVIVRRLGTLDEIVAALS